MTEDVSRRMRDFQLGINRSTAVGPGFATADALLASTSVGQPMARWLADTFNKNFDDYDRAVDSAYNATKVGGSALHHLVDGQHSIWGAFKSVQDVSADDTWAQELCQAGEHLLRDTMSVSGINPLFSMTPEQYEQVAELVGSAGVTRAYLADALTVNGPELFGGVLALAGSVVVGKTGDPDRLSRLGGSYVVSALWSANPLLLPVAAYSLVNAISAAPDKKAAFVQAGKGSLVTGTTLLVSTIVGGPLWVGALAGVAASVAVRQAIDNPKRAWERAQQLVAPAKAIFSVVGREVRKITHAPA